jgi:hypothetical protein
VGECKLHKIAMYDSHSWLITVLAKDSQDLFKGISTNCSVENEYKEL